MKQCCKDAGQEQISSKEAEAGKKGMMKWIKRFGIFGFLFFLIKGILWLTVGAAAIRYLGCSA